MFDATMSMRKIETSHWNGDIGTQKKEKVKELLNSIYEEAPLIPKPRYGKQNENTKRHRPLRRRRKGVSDAEKKTLISFVPFYSLFDLLYPPLSLRKRRMKCPWR